MRVVLDTNVIVAAFASRGICEAVFSVCLDAHEIVLSRHILDEVHRNLMKKLKMPRSRADQIRQFLQEHATIVSPLDVPSSSCRDQNDLPVLGTLRAAKAQCLITGDKDLLTLGDFEDIPILSPKAFYDRLLK